ncbi:MAG TPA: DUF222 domain-containing protein, partial [Agromyces sp.]|nr:DUF222 domain-containing protein [Agromyces sp.]
MTNTADIADQLSQLGSALYGVFGFDDPAGWRDDDLLTITGALETVGRVIDAQRAAVAGEIAERSRAELGDSRLSARKGCRSATELIERVTQVSGFEARRRVSIGTATRTRSAFTGQSMPAQHPHVAAALSSGVLGADAAATIIRELGRTRSVADPHRLDTAEAELVDQATGTGQAAPVRATADEVRIQAQAWAVFLD